jgi:hypothetical protein
MTAIAPPADLSRAERKAFRNLVKRLEDRGIDPLARVGLIEDFVRIEARLCDLRKGEKASHSLAASRAVNVATAERRRLHEAIFRGAKKPAAKVAPEELEDEGAEAWRAYFHHADRSLTAAQLERRYGPPGWGPLLHATAAEEAREARLLASQ